MGRWRDDYTIGTGRRAKKRPVEASAVHLDGRELTGPEGLVKILMEDKEVFAKNFVNKMFVYAMCREITYIDRDHLKRTYQECVKNGYRLQDLLIDIIAADSFARR